MTERYRFAYSDGTVYQSVVSLVRQFRVRDASVVIDVGCGFGAVAEPLRDEGLTYIGFDADASGLADLEARGFEVAQVDLLDIDAALPTMREQLAGRSLAAVMMIDTLEHLSNGADVLRGISKIASNQGSYPLVIAVPNVTHLDIGVKTLMGRWDVTETGILDSTHVAFFSSDGLRRTTNESGWVEIGSNDFVLRDSDQHFPADAVSLQRGTPLHDLLASVRGQACEGALVNEFVRAYSPLQRASSEVGEKAQSPFLSVLMRTQGKRHATIQESLLALAAQTSQNFELLVLAHDVPRDRLGDLRYLADCFGEDFSRRVGVVSVDGGGRSRPLNVGVEQARGQYLAVLDDDDVVFGHWVETFERFADRARGRIIRCVPAEQDVRPTKWPGGETGYTATSAPRCPWPEQFDLLDHLLECRTPPCSYALPRSAFADLGIRFDEMLPVVEDWDVLLRVALMCGVTDTGEVTALWRKWRAGGDSSKLIHSDAEWRQARDVVIAKLDSQPLLFPARSMSGLLKLQSRIEALNAMQDKDGAISDDWESLMRRASVADESLRAVEVIKSSTSWKLTMPIRAVGRLRRSVSNRRRSS